MDFIVLDHELETKYKTLLRRIHRLQSGGTIDSIQKTGADTRGQIGASFVSLKSLAGNYTPDEKLAILLWRSRKREEQIMACFLLPKIINKEIITQLTRDCYSFEIAEYFGSVFLSGHPGMAEIATEWSNSPCPFHQVAALTATAHYLIVNKKDSLISVNFLKNLVNREYQDKYVQLAAERYRFNI